jgi:hypothetical protein
MMAKLVKEESDGGRLHIDSNLMGKSLVSKEFLKSTESEAYFRMHPDINVLKIGGQSIMDSGGDALFPILDALKEAKEKYKILLMTGGGTRARHVYNIGVDFRPSNRSASGRRYFPPAERRHSRCDGVGSSRVRPDVRRIRQSLNS